MWDRYLEGDKKFDRAEIFSGPEENKYFPNFFTIWNNLSN